MRTKSYLLPLASLLVGILSSVNLMAQTPFEEFENLFSTPKHYSLIKSPTPIIIDGELNEKGWIESEWTEQFIDIEGVKKEKPAFKTQVKMMWDEKYLYIAAKLEEPHIWANKRPENDIIFRDNVFKIFIDPDNNMNDDFEIQINPQNNMLFLIMNKPYRDGGIPVSGWTPIGYRSAVKIEGSINNSTDIDKGWTAEIALPLAAFSFNPKDSKQNSRLRINFLRTNFDFLVKDGVYSKAVDSTGKAFPPHYSVWSSQGLINMHYPERWGYTSFSENMTDKEISYKVPFSESQRKFLWLCYYKQKEYWKKNKRYALTFDELNFPNTQVQIEGKTNKLLLQATNRQFIVSIQDEESKSIINLDQDGLITY